MTETTINREYKDRLFTQLFGRSENKAWTLELYNAVNGSAYSNPDEIEITTMDDTIYMGMKNDVSFILNDFVNIYEQQSSYNPNMPIRQLSYAGRLYEKHVKKHSLNVYGRRVVKLPVPKLVVFYNGDDYDAEKEKILYLSDAFDEAVAKESDITVRVRMININHECNKELLNECKPLAEYSWFVSEIRKNKKELNLEIEDAVDKAVDEMPEEYLIKPFLKGHRAEVRMGFLTEYDEAEVIAMNRRDAKNEGLEEGRDNTLRAMISKKVLKGKDLESIADELEMEVSDIRPLYDEVCKMQENA